MVHILQLPDEILEYILDNLPPYRDLLNCKEVCHRLCKIVQNVLKHKRLNLNKGLMDFNLLWKNYALGNRNLKLIPAPRYAHSSILIGNFMYVFGGSSVGGAFNDLWCFDLSKREWFRPISMGNYPNPKANSSLVQYKDTLILFGGRRQTSRNQPHLLFNELHCYDLEERRWTVKNFVNGPNPTAAHSATVHRDKMVIFGGYSRLENDVQDTTNDVWYLDLKTFIWRKPKIFDKKPTSRYGQFQVAVDDDNLMIMGGCGGPNNLFNDAWILNMSGEVWKWEPINIKNKKFTANHMWCNPAAVVDNKLVIIGPTPAQPIDLKIPKQALPVGNINNRVVRPEIGHNLQQPPPPVDLLAENRPRLEPQPDRRRSSVENQRNPINNNNNNRPNGSFNDEALRLQRSLCIRSGGSSSSSSSSNSTQNNWDPNLPRRFNEPIVHGTIKMAAFNVEKNSQLPQQIQRERQLENFRRMELKIQRERERNNKRHEEEQSKKVKRIKTNCLAIFVCDFSKVVSNAAAAAIEWIEYKNFGLFDGAPEKIMFSSMVAGTGELILFGGLQQQRESTTETATNAIHFLTYPTQIL